MSIPEFRRPFIQSRRSLLVLGALLPVRHGLAAGFQSIDPQTLREQRDGWMREGEIALAALDNRERGKCV